MMNESYEKYIDMLEELLYYLDREMKKLERIFKEIEYKGDNNDVWNLVKSYWGDCKYFYSNKEYVKAFELVNYIWGMLDTLANLDLIKIPEKYKKWFKI